MSDRASADVRETQQRGAPAPVTPARPAGAPAPATTPAPATPAPIIDAHITLGEGRSMQADPGRTVALMERLGIASALVSPVDRELAVANREGNDRVLDLARRYPGRLLAYATANPWFEAAAVAELERALGEGAVAIKLHPPLQGFMILDDLVHPLIEVAARRKVPVYVHTGTPVQALPFQLAELARTYPEVPFIMGKCGKTDFWIDAVPALGLSPNQYADTAHDYPDTGMRRLAGSVGPARMIFSSNHPASNMSLELAKVQALAVAEPERQAILGGNLARLLGAPSRDVGSRL